MELTMNMKGIYINRSKEGNAQISVIYELFSFDVRCFANFQTKCELPFSFEIRFI